MNRIEFMTELAALLQDVPVEERQEAMKYYNDYFDDAGQENEQKVIEELENPAKVAATIKAGLDGGDKAAGEFGETGYKDQRFEQKDVPAGAEGYNYQEKKDAPRSSSALKIILIIAIIIVGSPVIVPLTLAVVGTVVALVFFAFFFFLALVIASVAVTISGVFVFCVGIISLVPELAAGMALVGSGLLLTVAGVIATVVSVRLCIIVFPGIIRGLVWICRRPFQRKVVA